MFQYLIVKSVDLTLCTEVQAFVEDKVKKEKKRGIVH